MNILYFASLREQLDTDHEQWPTLEGLLTVEDLIKQLQARGEPWHRALGNPSLIVSVNQEVVHFNHQLTANDEVAFFPPVTGG
jgi:molybdopterin synthase sulfur carrier subunit